jgi:hypothetical protein
MFHLTLIGASHDRPASLSESGGSLVLWLIAVPPLAVGLASEGAAEGIGLAIGLSWLALLPIVLYTRRLSFLLPVCAAMLFLASLLALPFNSTAFIMNAWTTLIMALVTFPRPSRGMVSGVD